MKPYVLLNTIHISSFRCVSHLAIAIIERQYKNENLVGKPSLRLKTVIRRDVNDRKVIEEAFMGKFKKWRQSKKINGPIIYTEKVPYLQSSFLNLIQSETQGCRSYGTVKLDYHSRITFYVLHPLGKKYDLPNLLFVNPCT